MHFLNYFCNHSHHCLLMYSKNVTTHFVVPSSLSTLCVSFGAQCSSLNVAKYHLGEVKLDRVGQQSLPTLVRDLWGALGELQGSLCALLLVLCCIVALLADHSGSIFAFLRITADSCSLSSLPSGFIIISQISILLGKYLH